MKRGFFWLIAMLLLLQLCARPVPAAEAQGPTLRQRNYLALLPEAGRTAEVNLKAEQFSPIYSDTLRYLLIGPDSSTLATGEVALGKEQVLPIPAQTGELHALEVDSGWNICRVDSRATPSALVAWEAVPLHTVREIPRLYFYVPAGCRQFSLWLVAEVTGEAARLQICGPDGGTILEEEGDYDKPQRIRVSVPAGSDGKAWSLAILRPKAKGLRVDDVTLWLDAALPPYLSATADWALLFGRRKHP